MNEILSPSIFPPLIAISLPSGPVVVPVSIVPSALKLNPTWTAPIGVSSEPVDVPSTLAALAGAATSISTEAATSDTSILCDRGFMGTLLFVSGLSAHTDRRPELGAHESARSMQGPAGFGRRPTTAPVSALPAA